MLHTAPCTKIRQKVIATKTKVPCTIRNSIRTAGDKHRIPYCTLEEALRSQRPIAASTASLKALATLRHYQKFLAPPPYGLLGLLLGYQNLSIKYSHEVTHSTRLFHHSRSGHTQERCMAQSTGTHHEHQHSKQSGHTRSIHQTDCAFNLELLTPTLGCDTVASICQNRLSHNGRVESNTAPTKS